MRRCVILEAWVQSCRQEGRTRLKADSAKGRHRFEMAYKEAVVRSQPRLWPKNKPKNKPQNKPKNGWRPAAMNGRRKFAMSEHIRPLIAGNWNMIGLKASWSEFEAMLAGSSEVSAKADLLV